MNQSFVASCGGAVNTAVIVVAEPGPISSYSLSLTRPSKPVDFWTS